MLKDITRLCVVYLEYLVKFNSSSQEWTTWHKGDFCYISNITNGQLLEKKIVIKNYMLYATVCMAYFKPNKKINTAGKNISQWG